MIANDIHPAPMLCYTRSMILHPRAAANIAEHQHLYRDFGLSRRYGLRRRMFYIATRPEHEQDGDCGRDKDRQGQRNVQHDSDVSFRSMLQMLDHVATHVQPFPS